MERGDGGEVWGQRIGAWRYHSPRTQVCTAQALPPPRLHFSARPSLCVRKLRLRGAGDHQLRELSREHSLLESCVVRATSGGPWGGQYQPVLFCPGEAGVHDVEG